MLRGQFGTVEFNYRLGFSKLSVPYLPPDPNPTLFYPSFSNNFLCIHNFFPVPRSWFKFAF